MSVFTEEQRQNLRVVSESETIKSVDDIARAFKQNKHVMAVRSGEPVRITGVDRHSVSFEYKNSKGSVNQDTGKFRDFTSFRVATKPDPLWKGPLRNRT